MPKTVPAIILISDAVTVNTTSAEIAAAVSHRSFFHIQNNGANPVYVHFGSDAATTTNGIKLVSGAEVTIREPGVGAIQAISTTGSSACVVTTENRTGNS